MSNKYARGFTLIEILVSSTLLFICLSISIMCFNAGSNNFARTRETIDATQNCYTILEMIETELREADPATIDVTPAKLTITKFHNPSQEIQNVEWSYDSIKQKAIRTFSSVSVLSSSFELGENITKLDFNRVDRPITPAGNSFIKVDISMELQGRILSYAGQRRNIINLKKEIAIRRDLDYRANVTFVPAIP